MNKLIKQTPAVVLEESDILEEFIHKTHASVAGHPGLTCNLGCRQTECTES